MRKDCEVEAHFEEVSGKPGRGWDLCSASELIGTALLFYPPTERVVFGRHTSGWPASTLSRPSLLQQRGAPPSLSALNTCVNTHAIVTYPQHPGFMT